MLFTTALLKTPLISLYMSAGDVRLKDPQCSLANPGSVYRHFGNAQV